MKPWFLSLALVASMAVSAHAASMEEQLRSVKITPAQAASIAKALHAGEVDEIELKAREGSPVYEVKFADESKLWIDAQSGKAVQPRDRKPTRRHKGKHHDERGVDGPRTL
jgi:hypothetical protein